MRTAPSLPLFWMRRTWRLRRSSGLSITCTAIPSEQAISRASSPGCWKSPETLAASGWPVSADAAGKRVQRARRLLQPRVARLLGLEPSSGRRDPGQWRCVQELVDAVGEIVRDYRIVDVQLPNGGQMQFCLRAERKWARREREI